MKAAIYFRHGLFNARLFDYPFVAQKKGPDNNIIGAFKNKSFNLILGFRFLSFFFSFYNGFRD